MRFATLISAYYIYSVGPDASRYSVIFIKMDRDFPTGLNHLLKFTLLNGNFPVSGSNNFNDLYRWIFQGFINGLNPLQK